ncbi:MAG: hypothetical protein ACYTG0_23355 [Planctomycetota bacterium]|jgi:hypothetical protein
MEPPCLLRADARLRARRIAPAVAKRGNTQKVSTGNSLNNQVYTGQQMKIVAEGIGTGQGITSIEFKIPQTTSFFGYASNRSDAQVEGADDDYSFKQLWRRA